MAKKKTNKEEEMGLEAILHYEMDETESLAYQISLIWLKKSREYFPDYRHATMKKGDPRKSLVFKMCYKLVRETKGILQATDYPLYIKAQLQVLKYINEGKAQPLIDPNCLVGEKAWKRWKVWKKKYDAITNKPKEISAKSKVATGKALEGLQQSKEFLVKVFGDTLEFEAYNQAYLNNNIFRWINFGKISPYYVCLSPYLKLLLTENDFKKINFNLDVYKQYVCDLVLQKFKELFPQESERNLN